MGRPYAEVIGDPIAHSKSPLIHNFWLEKLGIDAEYRACHVKPEELADYFARRRGDAAWRGCNVTIPHKVSVLEFADVLDPWVESVGASNCMIRRENRLFANNTDRYGIGDALPLELDSVCILGAGGAARAAVAVLDVMDSPDVRIVARNQDRATASLSGIHHRGLRHFGFDAVDEAMRGVECVINASSLGMIGQARMPHQVIEALGLTQPGAVVFDMVYSPLETELLREARSLGRRPVDGLVMLISQAAYAFRYFFGEHPDRDGLYNEELRALLTA